MRNAAVQIQAAVMAVALLLVMGCAGARQVTYQGALVDDFTAKAANRLYNVETGLVLAGETALAARKAGYVKDEDWDRLADLSNAANEALKEARGVLIEYRRLRDNQTMTRVERALSVLDSIAAAVLRYSLALEGRASVIGTLEARGGGS